MDQLMEEPPQQQFRKLQKRLHEQFEIRDRTLRREFASVHERIGDFTKDNEARDKGIKREFRNVHEKMDSGFSRVDESFRHIDERFRHVDERFRHVDEKMDKMSRKLDRMDTLEALFANSKVVHLNQKIQAIPVYDSLYQPVPAPKCFPQTALRLYRLQDRKNWSHLKTLLQHYDLEKATIGLIVYGELYDSDSDDHSDDTSSRLHSIDDKLDRAIEANPFAAMSSLARHLGVDIDTLYDRVKQIEFQHEFQQKRGTLAKRPAEDEGSSRKRIRDMIVGAQQLGSFRRKDPFLDKDSDGKYTKLEWEVDSDKFKQATAHLRLRDTERVTSPYGARDSQTNQQHKNLQVASPGSEGVLLQTVPTEIITVPTEKMTPSNQGR
ncbi:hypothetical protein IFM51744_10203 [Aspergillus udagawae]|nr:hypothetical protein IFM51744_10203 [Aspergillus udagawae]